MTSYLRIWLACARYSIVRTLMFRLDFVMWSLVELFWMAVNVLLIEVIYGHTPGIAGWTKYEMLLLVGTSMLVQRIIMGLFWSNLFEMARNIRTGHFDYFLAQPGQPLFMVSTRKLDLEGLANAVVALALIVHAVHALGLTPSLGSCLLYALMILCGVLIHYGALLIIVSLTFWLGATQGVEGSYFTLMEFSRLPREAFRGVGKVLFVWLLPAVVVSNVPAAALLRDFTLQHTLLPALWLLGVTVLWLSLGVWVFHRGLRRYASASS